MSAPARAEGPEQPTRAVFRRMLVGFDGSEHSTKALSVACMMAKERQAKVIVVSVFSSPMYATIGPTAPVTAVEAVEEHARARAVQLVSQAIAKARSEGVEATGEALKAASAVQAIREYAQRNEIDLIVLGTRGLTGFKKMVLGSVSSGVTAHAHCPVLVVR